MLRRYKGTGGYILRGELRFAGGRRVTFFVGSYVLRGGLRFMLGVEGEGAEDALAFLYVD